MFQAHNALFLYCVSPVHMGAGTAIGLIDNPIQRERHTDYPLFAGSGLKGAVRHHCAATWGEEGKGLVERLFGPETNASDFAGAVSFGDAQLVAFPVRCTRRAYVYATSPTALARAKRQLTQLGQTPDWKVPEVQEGFCRVVPGSGPAEEGQPLHLEVFENTAIGAPELKAIADWLAEHALPQSPAHDFFRARLRSDLVLLPEEDFGHFVKNATLVEPHVRIDDETGTADGGGLFYTENLPPESLLLAPLMASKERSGAKKRGEARAMSADEVLASLLGGVDGRRGLNGELLQVGGDASTGRGQILVTVV